MINSTYNAKHFNLSGLNGISDRTLEMHFKLYEGYVKGTNDLNQRIADILADGVVDQDEMPAYSELTRRLGFEYNGMILHEYYFGNMKKDGSGDPDRNSDFHKATLDSFGSYEVWKADFVGIGKMRGVGWAICCQNPANGALSNHWVSLHEVAMLRVFIQSSSWTFGNTPISWITSRRIGPNTLRRSSPTSIGERWKGASC